MFKKYPTLINHYNQKDIDFFVYLHPQILECEYIVQEKLDGANFSIITDGETVEFATRNGVIKEDEKFFNWQQVMEEIKPVIEKIVECAKDEVITIQLYGELFGGNIQKRIGYSAKPRILFYDIRVNGFLETPIIFYAFANELEIIDLCVKFKKYNNLMEALNVEVEGEKTVYDYKDSPYENKNIEGIVIKPYKELFYSPTGSTFIVKKKAEKFKEVFRKPRKKTIKNVSPECSQLMSLYLDHLTENRMMSVFSKIGEIEDIKDMRKYIVAILDDANEEFFKNKENKTLFEILDAKEKRVVIGLGGKVIPKMLMKFLNSQ